MGQKVNPIAFRTGVYRKWNSSWFSRNLSGYADSFLEDQKIYDFFKKGFSKAEIGKIEIEKTVGNLRVVLYSARPGFLIGKKGRGMDSIRARLLKILDRSSLEVSVKEIVNPGVNAYIIAQSIAEQIAARVSYKRAVGRVVSAALRAGAKGIKVRVAGRIGGAEIARGEWRRVGSTPLHTLRSDVDYASVESLTTYGIIGVKVWVCMGEYSFVKDR